MDEEILLEEEQEEEPEEDGEEDKYYEEMWKNIDFTGIFWIFKLNLKIK